MKVPPLATLLSTFFLRYLAVERGVSPHTSTSYRDAIKLLLQFSAARCKRSVDQLVIEDLNAPFACPGGFRPAIARGMPPSEEGPCAEAKNDRAATKVGRRGPMDRARP